jgi:hypothetical protein
MLFVQSVYHDQWWSNIKSAKYLCEIRTGKTERGVRQRGQKERHSNRLREREREREREWVLGRNGFSVSWKCPLEEIEQHLSIFSKSRGQTTVNQDLGVLDSGALTFARITLDFVIQVGEY